MKELDVLLTTYLERHFSDADAESQQRFRELLEWPDPDLFALLMGKTTAPDAQLEAFAERLRYMQRDR